MTTRTKTSSTSAPIAHTAAAEEENRIKNKKKISKSSTIYFK